MWAALLVLESFIRVLHTTVNDLGFAIGPGENFATLLWLVKHNVCSTAAAGLEYALCIDIFKELNLKTLFRKIVTS